MKGRDVAKAFRQYLVPHLPPCEVRGSLLYLTPANRLLRGIVLETSAYNSQHVTVECFVQPLYIPRDCITFFVGDRLGRRTAGRDYQWTVTPETQDVVFRDIAEKVQQEALPFWQRFRSPRDLVEHRYGDRFSGTRKDGVGPEPTAYSWLLENQPRRALRCLRKQADEIAGGKDRRGWVLEELARLRKIEALIQQDLNQAVAQLDEWAAYTRAALKLPEPTSPDPPPAYRPPWSWLTDLVFSR